MLGLIIGAAVAAQIVDSVKENNKVKNKMNAIRPGDIVMSVGYSELISKNFRNVIRILLGMGFVNICPDELRDKKENFFNKNEYGRVLAISINGNSIFEKNDAFNKEAYVYIKYQAFKDSPYITIPELDAMKKEKAPKKEDIPMYCEYCDCLLIKGSKNCSRCGAPVLKKKKKASQEDSSQKICPRCGTILFSYEQFCHACGSKT